MNDKNFNLTKRCIKNMRTLYRSEAENNQLNIPLKRGLKSQGNGIWENRLQTQQERDQFRELVIKISSDFKGEEITQLDAIQIDHLAILNLKLSRAMDLDNIEAMVALHQMIRKIQQDLTLTRQNRKTKSEKDESPADFVTSLVEKFNKENNQTKNKEK